jgi:hypothetical protein
MTRLLPARARTAGCCECEGSGLTDAKQQVLRRDALRLAFLRRLYDGTDGNPRHMVHLDEIAAPLELGHADAMQVLDYLRGEGLAEVRAFGPLIEITHFGIQEVEESIRNPDRGTVHFSPAVIQQTIFIGNRISNSPIAVASGDVQQAVASAIDLEALANLVRELRASLPSVGIDDDQRLAVILDLESADAQLRSPKPNRAVLREALKSTKSVMEGAIGGAMTPELVDLLHRLGHAIEALVH